LFGRSKDTVRHCDACRRDHQGDVPATWLVTTLTCPAGHVTDWAVCHHHKQVHDTQVAAGQSSFDCPGKACPESIDAGAIGFKPLKSR
jgi:uncharacterized Zn-binding protein involved in type VI secretion